MRSAFAILLALCAACVAAEPPVDAPLAVRIAGIRLATVVDPDLHPDDPADGWRLVNHGLDADSRIVLRLVPSGAWQVVASTPPEILEAVADGGVALEAAPSQPWQAASSLHAIEPDPGELPSLMLCRFRTATTPLRTLTRLRIRVDVRLGDDASLKRARWPVTAGTPFAVAGDALRFTPRDDTSITVDGEGDAVQRLKSVVYRGPDEAARHLATMRWQPRDSGLHADIVLDGPVAAVETVAYTKLRALRVEATFTDVPLVGLAPAPAPVIQATELPAPDLPALTEPPSAAPADAVKDPGDF